MAQLLARWSRVIAITAILIPLRAHVNSTTVGFAFLLAVLFVAIIWGSMPALFESVCLIQLDKTAAWVLIPYLIYRLYAVWCGYELWRLISRRAELFTQKFVGKLRSPDFDRALRHLSKSVVQMSYVISRQTKECTIPISLSQR